MKLIFDPKEKLPPIFPAWQQEELSVNVLVYTKFSPKLWRMGFYSYKDKQWVYLGAKEGDVVIKWTYLPETIEQMVNEKIESAVQSVDDLIEGLPFGYTTYNDGQERGLKDAKEVIKEKLQ